MSFQNEANLLILERLIANIDSIKGKLKYAACSKTEKMWKGRNDLNLVGYKQYLYRRDFSAIVQGLSYLNVLTS